MYITTTNKLDPSSSITVASGPATQVEIDKVPRIWPSMSDSVENLALLYRRQQAKLNANDTDFKRLWSEVNDQGHDIKKLATLLYELQESHADMASRVEYLENLLADREMQEGDIEIKSAEEDSVKKKGNGIDEAASEEDASDLARLVMPPVAAE